MASGEWRVGLRMNNQLSVGKSLFWWLVEENTNDGVNLPVTATIDGLIAKLRSCKPEFDFYAQTKSLNYELQLHAKNIFFRIAYPVFFL